MPQRDSTREALLTAMKESVLASASLAVSFTRGAEPENER